MKLNIYQAECGDALSIGYIGIDGRRHNVFLDSGYERTYTCVLEGEIKRIIKYGEEIDLWIISHIHDDHIGGVTAYIDAVRNGSIKDVVNSWYYNSPRGTSKKENEISSAKSIEQGDYLNKYLESNGKQLIFDITNSLSAQDVFGLSITVLSPDDNTLKKLRDKYQQDGFRKLSYEELTEISEAVAARKDDYDILVQKFDLDEWKEDTSVENRSSISVLIDYNNKKLLFLADSHPSLILESLKKLGYSKENQLECSWVMIAHHGSKGNNSTDLYDHIKCNNYILSVNGENKHYLPTKESIVRILKSKAREKNSHYKLYFTYDNETLRSIFKIDGDKIYKELNFSMVFQNKNKIEIEL